MLTGSGPSLCPASRCPKPSPQHLQAWLYGAGRRVEDKQSCGSSARVLSPLAGFYAGIRPPCVRFLFFRRGASLGTRMASKSIRLPPERCRSPVQGAKAVSLLGGRFGPDRALM